MVCDVVEMTLGVGMAWARRDGVGVPGVAAVPALVASEVLVAVVPSLLSVLAALVSVDVAAPSSTVSVVSRKLV